MLDCVLEERKRLQLERQVGLASALAVVLVVLVLIVILPIQRLTRGDGR